MTKKTKKVEVEEPQEEVLNVTQEVVEQPKPKKTEPKKPTWEIKDRVYYLSRKRRPLSYMVRSANIYYFDEEKRIRKRVKVL